MRWNNVFLALGLAELISGLTGALLADWLPIFNQLAVVAGVLALIVIPYCIFRPRLVKVYDLVSAGLMLAYGAGTLNSVVAFGMDHQHLVQNSDVAQYWFTRTLALVLCVCGCLHLAGRADPDGHILKVIRPADTKPIRTLMFIVPLFLLYCVLLKTGKIGFMANVSVDGGAEVSPLSVLVLMVVTPAGALGLCEALKLPQRGAAYYALMAFSILLLVSQFGLGRRIFMFSCEIYVMCALLIRPPKRLFTAKSISLLLLTGFVLYAATTTFYALRLASWAMDPKGVRHYTILELAPKAIEMYTKNRRSSVQASAARNVKLRTFVLQYLTELSRGEAFREPLYGQDLERAFVVATPIMLYPDKLLDKRFEPEEPLINPAFGIPIFDGPNSILTGGVSDFGVFGLFLYPIVACLLFARLLHFLYKRAPPQAGIFLALIICQNLMEVEADMARYLVTVRTMIPIAICIWIYFGWTHRAQANGVR